jgi:hypothetical protein
MQAIQLQQKALEKWCYVHLFVLEASMDQVQFVSGSHESWLFIRQCWWLTLRGALQELEGKGVVGKAVTYRGASGFVVERCRKVHA